MYFARRRADAPYPAMEKAEAFPAACTSCACLTNVVPSLGGSERGNGARRSSRYALKEAGLHGRLLRPLVVLAATLAAFLGVVSTATTAAVVRSNGSQTEAIASYCSSSGDICFGVFNRGGRARLKITTAARYFSRYTLCVTRLPAGGRS